MRNHRAKALKRALCSLRANVSQIEGERVTDPLSPFVGEDVVSRREVLTAIDQLAEEQGKHA
jgi:hypothetical protein